MLTDRKMARKRSKRRSKRAQRVRQSYSKRELLRSPALPDIRDERTFHPSRDLPYDDRGREASISLASGTLDNRAYYAEGYRRLAFDNPAQIKVCRSRRARREILFRLQKIGKGKGGAQRRRVLRPNSAIRC